MAALYTDVPIYQEHEPCTLEPGYLHSHLASADSWMEDLGKQLTSLVNGEKDRI